MTQKVFKLLDQHLAFTELLFSPRDSCLGMQGELKLSDLDSVTSKCDMGIIL